MENVLTAVIVIFLFLFAGYTLSESLINSQDTLATAELARDERMQELTATSVQVTDATTRADGTEIQISLRNDGSTKLYDFERWDVIAQYTNVADSYAITWTPYSAAALLANQWTIEAIQVGDSEEQYEPGMLNPGETAVIIIKLAAEVQTDSSLNIVISTENARTTTLSFPRNAIPTLDVLQGMRITSHDTETISSALLAASDTDDEPGDITFTVETAPTQGILSASSFTQADIDAGTVSYAHSGTGNDSFTFVVTDGKDTLSGYTFHIFISEAPILMVKSPLVTTVTGTGAIYNTMLRADDSDDSTDEVIYTVISGPTQGYLSLGTTFTQADIDAGLLTYTHTGITSDMFSFTVTDGETIIGPYVYEIQVM